MYFNIMFLKKIFLKFFCKFRKLNTGAVDYDREVMISGVNVFIGKYTYGSSYIQILKWTEENNSVRIGRFCSLSYGLKIFTGGNHRKDWISTYPFGHINPSSLFIPPVIGHPDKNKPVVIENDCWIGRDVTIMSGVTIHNGAVIAANSHVVTSIPPYAIAGGNPAKVIRYRFNEETIVRILKIKWWDFPKDKLLEASKILCQKPSLKTLRSLEGIK